MNVSYNSNYPFLNDDCKTMDKIQKKKNKVKQKKLRREGKMTEDTNKRNRHTK